MSTYDTMQVPIASDGKFGIAIQSGKGVVPTDPTAFRYFQYTNSPFGITQPITQLPQMSGGNIIPAGTYKSGVHGAGAVNLIPFLDNNFGYLLLAAMGQDDVTLGYRIDQAGGVDIAATGINLHTFTYKTVQSDIPYLTTRKLIQTIPTPLGEQTQDGRIGNLELNLPGAGVMTATLDMLSRVPGDSQDVFTDDPFNSGTGTQSNDAGSWYDATLPGYDSTKAFALAADQNSVIRLGGVVVPCSGLVMTIANDLLQPDRARVIGSPTPVDYPVMGRRITFQATCFLTNYNLYKDIFSTGHTAADRGWSSSIVSGELDFLAYSPLVVGATIIQHAIQVRTVGGNVDWSLQGPVAQQAGEPLIMTVQGTLRMPDDDADPYVEVRLQNGQTAEYVPEA